MRKYTYTNPYRCPYCGGNGKGNHKENCGNDPYKKTVKHNTEKPTDEEITKAINER